MINSVKLERYMTEDFDVKLVERYRPLYAQSGIQDGFLAG